MKRFLTRIIICLLPTLVSIGVIGWAYNEYRNGRGGFRFGIDLVGGTILVYEVDETRLPDNFKPEDLAAALKKRIDPADLYNITIRPVPGTPPRVEIVLPTGGRYQAEAEQRAWQEILKAAAREYPVKEGENPYADILHGSGAREALIDRILDLTDHKRDDVAKKITALIAEKGKTAEGWKNVLAAAAKEFPPENPYADIGKVPNGQAALGDRIAALHPKQNRSEIGRWVERQVNPGGKERRTLTSEEVERIKELIERQGQLEFRILANNRDDLEAFQAAEAYFKRPESKEELARLEVLKRPPPPPRRDSGPTFPVRIRDRETEHTYSWVELGKPQLHSKSLRFNSEALAKDKGLGAMIAEAVKTGQPFQYPNPMIALADRGTPHLYYVRRITDWSRRQTKDRDQNKTLEFFILVRDPLPGQEITGDYLTRASEGRSPQGERAIDFTFNSEGGSRFYEVTKRNEPDGSRETGFKRQLAIIFDGQVVSAPNLNEPIRTNGQISGDFSQQDITDMVRILRAGALPATLKKDPVSQNSMSPTLGADTIEKGIWAVFWAFVAVMVFMVVYYRFAGFVACAALMANLLLTVAFMVIVQAAFTLPGLAGLVLMLGMAVDANVLIYERLREERERGATLALALRNGYDRAFPTIVDTHLSSIFTAIVLYVVGNDQLKGFGISLTVGLIISLFTSLYMTRLMFDIWMYKGWLKDLNFAGWLVKLVHARYWDFMSIRYYWFVGTGILTILGAALFIYRLDSDPATKKASVLNIDFVGGTAFTGQLTEPMTLTDLRTALKLDTSELDDATVEQIWIGGSTGDTTGGKSRYFTLRTTEKNARKVFDHVISSLGEQLVRIKLKEFELNPEGTSATVVFSDQGGKEPGYASPAQVQLLIANELGRRDLGRGGFEVIRPSDKTAKKGNEDRFSRFTIKLSEPLPNSTERDKKWKELLALVAKRYPAQGKDNPYAKIKVDDVGELVRTIQETQGISSPEEVRKVEAWIEDSGKVSTFALVLWKTQQEFASSAQPERLENFDSQLAATTRERAMYAIVASWIAIMLYLWFRFGSWTFGAATVVCLIHDLFFTLGVIAACHYLHANVPWLAYILGIQDFKIDLASVAALLTLVGYSVNDTIVVFDRIREVRGKNPALTPQIINDSVNQTLTRTLLASTTVFLVVLVLYVAGGEGVKLFAFVMVVGVVIGTYSSIYVASPLLLIFGEGKLTPSQADRARQEAKA